MKKARVGPTRRSDSQRALAELGQGEIIFPGPELERLLKTV